MEGEGTRAPDILSIHTPEDVVRVLTPAVTLGVGAVGYLVMKEAKRAMENESVTPLISKGMTMYLAAAGALVFTGRDLYNDNLVAMLEAADVVPNDDLINTLHMTRLRNHVIYINSVFFLMSTGKPPTIESELDIVKALGIAPDAVIAGYVIQYCNEYITLHQQDYEKEMDNTTLTGDDKKAFIRLALGAKNLSNNMASLVISETVAGLSNEGAKSHISPRMIPYIAAVGSLAFLGRDIDSENISKLLSAAGVSIDEELMDATIAMHFKNRLIYLISLYFLLVVGREPTNEGVINIVRALGAQPDAKIAASTVQFFNIHKAAGEFKWLDG